MAMKAILVDNKRCIGCRACMVACKGWNDRKASKTEFFSGPGYQNPRDLNADTWTLITFNELFVNGRFNWVFGNMRCMHCNEPACSSACPTLALEKLPEGPVVYHSHKCLGCRYCMMACPFLVPRFEWDRGIMPEITKCSMCHDRVSNGGIPACVKSCPTEALTFGDRDKMIDIAEKRIRSNPTGYVPQVYGKDDVGGTCVLHLSQVPFDKIGYKTDLPKKPLPEYTRTAMTAVPITVVGLGITLTAVYKIIQRRMDAEGAGADQEEVTHE